MDENRFDSWAIVELFGHQRIAGRVTEQTIGGCAFVRVDVPPIDEIPAYTRLLGQGAIYAINPCTEEISRSAAAKFRAVPVQPYDIPELRQLLGQRHLPELDSRSPDEW